MLLLSIFSQMANCGWTICVCKSLLLFLGCRKNQVKYFMQSILIACGEGFFYEQLPSASLILLGPIFVVLGGARHMTTALIYSVAAACTTGRDR